MCPQSLYIVIQIPELEGTWGGGNVREDRDQWTTTSTAAPAMGPLWREEHAGWLSLHWDF